MSASPLLLLSAMASLLIPSVVRLGSVSPPAASIEGKQREPSSEIARATVKRAATQQVIPAALRQSVCAIDVDHARLEAFAINGGGLLDAFPLGSGRLEALELIPMDAFESSAVVTTAVLPATRSGGKQKVGAPAIASVSTPIETCGTFLAGTVAGIDGSHAFLAVSEAGTYGYVEIPGHTYIISSGPYGRGFPTVSYDLSTLPEGAMAPPDWTCATVDGSASESGALNDGGIAGSAPCRQVRVAYETDHEFLQLFGGNTTAAVGYVGTLASALTAIYSRDLNVRVSASYVRLWPESADPWNANTTYEQLGQFRSNWDSTMIPVQRDLAHMLSGRALGGGVAYLPGLCNGLAQGLQTESGYGLSANLLGFFPTPLVDNDAQNWDIMVVAHEIGHNFGAQHTHAHVPPIDGCGSTPQDCTAAETNAGTIMSYCHLCVGGLTNIKLEFHPLTVQSIDARLNAISCNYTAEARNPVTVSDTGSTYTGIPLVLDVLSNEVEFNCETLTLGVIPASTFYGGVIARSVGTGPNGRDEIIYTMPDPSFAATDTFTYQVIDASNQTAQGTVSVSVAQLRVPENPSGTIASLDAEFFALTAPTSLPNFDVLTPYATSSASSISFTPSSGNFATSGRNDNVGAVFAGWIEIPTSGGWTFTLYSDEGSRLLIGDEVVVSNDGVHSMLEYSGTIGLAAGVHALRVEYFEKTGDAGLVVSWAGPGVAKAVIPAAALLRAGTDSPADYNNDGTVGAGDLSLLLSVWNSPSKSYDLTGDGFVNAMDLSAMLFAWTD